MVYGWAILVVLTSIGALAYFGVFEGFLTDLGIGCTQVHTYYDYDCLQIETALNLGFETLPQSTYKRVCEGENPDDIKVVMKEGEYDVKSSYFFECILEDVTSKDSEFWTEGHKFGAYWTCMDGCFEMQMILLEERGINLSESRHHKCSDRCWQIVMEEKPYDEVG